MIRYIIDVILISNAYPDAQVLKKLGSIDNLAIILEKIFSSLVSFEQSVKLKRLPIIRFWSDFTNVIAEQGP